MIRPCPCGFDPWSVTPLFGADWHRAHRVRHLATFPDVGEITRSNLELLVDWAAS